MKPDIGDYVICVKLARFFPGIEVGQRYRIGGYLDKSIDNSGDIVWIDGKVFPLDCFELDIKYTRLQKLKNLNHDGG